MKQIIEYVKELNYNQSYKFIAVDKDGKIWAFKDEPEFNEEYGWWRVKKNSGNFPAIQVGKTELPENVHPRDTCRKIV